MYSQILYILAVKSNTRPWNPSLWSCVKEWREQVAPQLLEVIELIAKVENCIGKTGNIPDGLGNDIKSGENLP